jgi:spore coat protein A, manganese oxidase
MIMAWAQGMSRRDLLKVSVLGTAALALPLEKVVQGKSASRISSKKLPKPFSVPLTMPPVLNPKRADATTDYYELIQRQVNTQILPGVNTTLWGYNGLVPGPTIKVQQGRKTVVRQINGLPSRHPTLRYTPHTSTHLHGSASSPEYDGYANDVSYPGQWKDYHYPNFQNARTIWYHDHGAHHTAQNVYMGLAAQYHIHDAMEAALPIPKGSYDVPLTISDAMFAENGQLMWDDKGTSGLWGDVILVNGRPWPVMQVQRRKYRFRILNGSIGRGYRLALSTGDPLVVIGTDAGLMEFPQPVAELRHGMAERYEVIIDFARYRVGQRIVLRNLGVKNGIEYDDTDKIMAFDVVGDASTLIGSEIPAVLNPDLPVMSLTPDMAVATRRVRLIRKKGLWTINGETWADVVDSRYRKVIATPDPNDVEIWEFTNESGGWFHPMHVHLVDFRILDRNGLPPRPEELGAKDVAYVGENETVRVIMRFEHQIGRYMLHCHNVSHEDHDMMAQFEVGRDGPDPITTAPAMSGPPPEL